MIVNLANSVHALNYIHPSSQSFSQDCVLFSSQSQPSLLPWPKAELLMLPLSTGITLLRRRSWRSKIESWVEWNKYRMCGDHHYPSRPPSSTTSPQTDPWCSTYYIYCTHTDHALSLATSSRNWISALNTSTWTTMTATGGDRCGEVDRWIYLPHTQHYARCKFQREWKGDEGWGEQRGQTADDPPEGRPQQNLRFTLMNSILYGLFESFSFGRLVNFILRRRELWTVSGGSYICWGTLKYFAEH